MVYAEGVDVSQITDLEEAEWAEPYIQKVTDTDVMPLYSTNEFKPLGHATKMEVINVIYRIALLKGDVTTDLADDYVTKHLPTIEAYLIPNTLEPYGPDNHRAIAYALERNILKKSELSLFFVNGKFEVISKVDASVFMSKAMNVYLKENVNKFYEIQYKDGAEITLLQWPWINLLIEKEIVVGGTDNYFYPNSILNRSILSVLSSNILNELDGVTVDASTDTETPVVTGTLTSMNGKISIIHYDLNIIEVRDENNKLYVYDASNGVLTLNDATITLQNLEPGMDVKVTAIGKDLKTLNVLEDLTSIDGTLNGIGLKVTVKGETFRPISISVNGQFKYYKALNSVVIERDYQTSTLDDLNEGDVVKISYQGDYVKKIEALSNKAVLDGALQRSTGFNDGDVVSIKLSNGKLFEQTIDGNIGKVNITSDLAKGDIVKITLEKGKITAVEGTGLSTEASGRITKIVISSSPSVSIMTKAGETKNFNIASNVVVNNLGSDDSNGLYALRLDQDVTLELSGMAVDRISINQSVEKTHFNAKITEIHKNINLLKAEDASGKVWIVSLEGSDQNINDYTVDDSVYIYGVEVSGELFEADLIIVLE
nr:S-layer homology domain-containing protein [Acidaminobacter sp. JC074]